MAGFQLREYPVNLLRRRTKSSQLRIRGGRDVDLGFGLHPLRSLALQASPSVQSEIPSRAKSLIRNCPGFPERAGKPPALGSQTPGVVTRKLRVVRNIPTARALPRADARGANGRAAMSSATTTSTTPSTAEKPRTLRGT